MRKSNLSYKTHLLRILAILCLLSSYLWIAPSQVHASPTGFQEYYVLGYEEHVWRAFREILGGSISSCICSTVSLVATADYQVVYYDHWEEDGYEANLLNPVQDTTEVYGDGDLSNGGTGSDILLAGHEINLTSNENNNTINGCVRVNPRDPSQIRYDGGDRVITTGGPVALAHAMWPFNQSWVGGAWEVYSRQSYAGYSYRLPIGEDLYTFGGGDTGTYGDLRDVFLQLGAFEDNTTILIDNGTDTLVLTLDRGQTYSSMGYINSTSVSAITINAGTAIRSNKPVQVGLVTGADQKPGGGSFQGRFLIVLPDHLWGADYVVPVPSGDEFANDGDEAEVYLSNPNDFPITINAYDAETQATFAISPRDYISATVPYSEKRGGLGYVPQDSAARFTSSDGVFGVIVCADTSDADYDWGFSGVPSKHLTRDYYVSWAPGDDNIPPQSNGSPVWVTPLANGTTFHVDYSPTDGVVDEEPFTLNVLEQRRIFDPDNDNTGMHVWATGEFAVVWGEDPRTAGRGRPYLDLGIATLPVQEEWLDLVLTLDKTAEPTILPPAGGTVTFTLVAQAHNKPLVNVGITDTLPINWTYVPGSTQVTYPDASTANPDPTPIDNRTLFWDLSTDLDISEILTLTFQAQITDTVNPVNINQGEAIGKHEYSDKLFNPKDEATIYISPLNLVKSVSSAQAEIGDTLLYTLSYINHSSSITATNVVLRDPVPIQHVTFQSASGGGVYDGASSTITWALGTLAPGDSGTVTFTVKVNDFVEDRTIIEDIGYVSSDQTVEAGSNAARTDVLAPDIEFTKLGPTVAAPGQVITYTLSYENVGRTQATEATIQDIIPISTTYVSGSLALNTGSGWVALTDANDVDQGAFISPTLGITPGVTPGAIAPGEAGQIRFSVQLDDDLPHGSLILNWATLDRNLDIPRDSNLMVTRISDLLIQKAAEQAVAAPSGVISYSLIYLNSSETVSQTNVYVREPIPDYTSFVTGTAYGGDQIEYSWDNGATWNTTLPITPLTHIRWHDSNLPPSTQETVGFTVQVNDPLLEGTTIQNIAYISSTQTSAHMGGWIPSNQVEVATVDLWVEKSVSQDTARASDPISYTISCGNHGSADAFGVQIVDTIPTGTNYISGTIWGTGADASGNPVLVWDVTTVSAGASAQQVGYAVALDAGYALGVVTNTATISNTYEVEMSNPVTTTVITEADLTVAKSDSPDPVVAGMTLTYTLVYTNNGLSSAQDVYITDTLPADVTFGGVVSAMPSITLVETSPPTWYTPTLAAGVSGNIVFTVTVHPDASGIITNNVVITSSTLDTAPDNNEDDEPTAVGACICPPDSYEEDDVAGQAVDLGVGVTQPHDFCDDATDWITFTAQADYIYTITTSSWGQRADTFLALFDTDAHTLLAANDDYEGTTDYSSRIVWTAPADGIYYVRTTNRAGLTGCATDYNLLIESQEQPAPDQIVIYLPIVMQNYGGAGTSHGNNVYPTGVISHTCRDDYETDDTWQQAHVIEADDVQIHSFDSNPQRYAADKDFVWFDVSAGRTLTFTITSITNTQTLLELYDGHGAALNVTGTTQLFWTPATAGRYYLSVSPLTTTFGCADVVGYDLLLTKMPEPAPEAPIYLPIIMRNYH